MLYIKNNSILIIPSNMKNNVIEEIRKNNPLLNIKFMSFKEFIYEYTFNYNNKTINYIMSKYKTNYETAKVYLENIYYLQGNIDKSKKLTFLSILKEELINNNMLILNPLFKEFIKDKNIVIYGYNYLTKLEEYIINELKSITNVEIVNNDYNYSHKNIYEFNDIEKEIEYVAIKIRKLLEENIDINNIKLTNINSEYYFYIKQIFDFYNIPISNLNNTYLSNTNIGIFTLKNIKSDLNETIQLINNKFDLNNEDNLNIYNKIIDIFNEYTWYEDDFTKIVDIIKADFASTIVNNNELLNKVTVLPLKNTVFNENDYVFLMSFNNEIVPIYHTDTDFLLDIEKKDTLTDTSLMLNQKEKNAIIDMISNTKNLTITYKLNSLNNTYTISMINNSLNYQVIKMDVNNYNYSNMYNKIKLSNMLDNLIKYNEKEDDLSLLYNTYKDINYLSYDNKYTGIANNSFKKYLDNKLTLSYSSLDNYYRCPFRYYISNILKLNKYEETFMIIIGKVFHYILSYALTDSNFKIEEEYDKYLLDYDYEFSYKEKYFFNKLKKELIFIIEAIKKQYTHTTFNKYLNEEEIVININNDISIRFIGFVDKIMYKEENNYTLVSIIDYKTGDTNIKLDNIKYGINMQLPVYLYLTKHSNTLNNVKFVGFYLQKLLHNEILLDYKHSYNELKEKNLLLEGYSISDTNYLEKFDDSYDNSLMIKSLKTTKSGSFYAYSKVIKETEIDYLISVVENKINSSIDPITKADFIIKPKNINGVMEGCKYCTFNDICYMKEEDIEYIIDKESSDTNEMD